MIDFRTIFGASSNTADPIRLKKTHLRGMQGFTCE